MNRLPWEAKKKFFDLIGYAPTDEVDGGQAPVHRSPERFKVVAGGWGSGKSYYGTMELAAHVFVGILPADQIFLIAGPTFEEPHVEFNLLVDALVRAEGKLGTKIIKNVSRPKERSWVLETVMGTKVETQGIRKSEDIRAWNCAGILVVEAGQVPRDSILNLQGRVHRTEGFIDYTGTMEETEPWLEEWLEEGRQEHLVKERDMRSFAIPTWTNTHAFPGGLSNKSLQNTINELGGWESDLVKRRIRAMSVPLTGLVLPSFRYDLHVRDVNPVSVPGRSGELTKLPVEVAVDPGVEHAYVVLAVQEVDGQVQVIDEIYTGDTSTEQVITVCSRRPWWGHTTAATGGVIDIAGTYRNPLGGEKATTVAQVWYEQTGLKLRGRKVDVADTVDRLQWALGTNQATGKPNMVISPKCKGLIYEMSGRGRPPYEKMLPWQRHKHRDGTFGPPRSIGDDACKALAYWLVDRYDTIKRRNAWANVRAISWGVGAKR